MHFLLSFIGRLPLVVFVIGAISGAVMMVISLVTGSVFASTIALYAFGMALSGWVLLTLLVTFLFVILGAFSGDEGEDEDEDEGDHADDAMHAEAEEIETTDLTGDEDRRTAALFQPKRASLATA